MSVAVACGYQLRERLSDHFFIGVSEELGSRPIPREDASAMIGHDDGIAGRIHQRAEAVFALAEEVFGPFNLHGEFRDPDGATERVPKFFSIIRFREIGIRPLRQRSHGAILRDMGGHNHDRERRVQALGFLQDFEPIAVRQAQVQDDGAEAMGDRKSVV